MEKIVIYSAQAFAKYLTYFNNRIKNILVSFYE